MTTFVAAQITPEGVEIRCGLCAKWWPATDEFYAKVSRCRACCSDVRLRQYARLPAQFEPKDSYAALKALWSAYPERGLAPRNLVIAMRRAYWREAKRRSKERTP